jgi:hypothetical protein
MFVHKLSAVVLRGIARATREGSRIRIRIRKSRVWILGY